MSNRKAKTINSLPIELWPTVNAALIPEEKRAKFEDYSIAVRLYFDGVPVADIASKTGVARTQLPRLAKRCLKHASDGRIFGFRALIPYAHTQGYNRVAPSLPKRQHQMGGLSGSLGMLFRRVPELEEELVKAITQRGKSSGIHEFRLRPKDLHRIFLDSAEKNGVRRTEWPFNTVHLGQRTIYKYMAALLNENFSRSVLNREEHAAKAHVNVGTGHATLLSFPEPYDAVEIDSYKVDALLTVVFRTPEGTETELVLERLWLIAVVDRASTAVLGYNLVYRSEVSADDILKAILDAVIKKWRPLPLTIPMHYPAGGGLPSGVIPEAFGAVWSITFFDGALAHLSSAVHERVRQTLGFVITWGAPGRFERRPNVERAFKSISEDIFKRLPSTTGSHPNSGRANDAEDQARRHKIRAEDVEQMLDVYIAQHNACPCEGISYLTPLEYICHFVRNLAEFNLRRLPEEMYRKTYMFAATEEVTVRGGRKDGRRPYVQLDRVHYTSPVLAELGNLIGEKLVLEIDEDDMRQVKAYLRNGTELGFLTAQGRWGYSKHSRRTRRAINSLASRRILVLSEFDDPVQVYVAHLTKEKAGKAIRDMSPSQVTDATRIANEADLPRTLIRATKQQSPGQIIDVSGRRSLLDRLPPISRMIKNHR